MAKLIVATHNAHKTGEIREMLGGLFDAIEDLTSVPDLVPPEEDGHTFAENSAIKALAASRESPEAIILADDSGLEVDALGGEPGVHSSRYAGEDATDADNRDKLMQQLSGVEAGGGPRTARFRCVVTVAKGGEILQQFDGAVEGHIVDRMAGDGGFGYDPLFAPEGHKETFGELSAETKNGMSHRARAIEKFRSWWEAEGSAEA